MSLWTFFRHRLRAYRRVPFFGRRVLSLILGGFLALYLGGGLVLVGLVFDDLVREAAPGTDPLLVASRWLLPLGLLYTAVRMFVESGFGIDVRAYLALPLRRSVLAGVVAVLSLFSLWNAVPLAFVATVCIEAALDGALGPALRFGIVSIGVLAAVTYAVPMVRRGMAERPLLAAAGGLLIVASVGLEWIDVWGGGGSLLDVSGALLGGVVQGHVASTVTFVVGMGGGVYGHARWLRGAMVLDEYSPPASAMGESSSLLARLARRGPIWREAALEMRLLLRNTQTRITIFNVLLFVGVVIFFGVWPIEASELRNPMTTLFPGLFATGGIVIWHGQNLFGYEGACFDGTMARPARARDRVVGKVLFLAAVALACFLVPLPVLLWTGSPFLAVHTSFLLYNVGLLAPATVAGATFNRKALAISEMTFSQTNFSGVRTAVVLPLFALPAIPIWLIDAFSLRFGIIAGLGLLSAMAWPLWRRGLAALYRRNRHAMARGFRASRE